MSETTFQKIIRRTGRKPQSCKCSLCKKQCQTCPCLGTPEDIQKIKDAGFADKIFPTVWAAGLIMGVIDREIDMEQPGFNEETGSCVFYKDGLCQLHDLGLKPTEGRLSHHSHKIDNFNPKKSLAWAVAKEWIK